MEAPEARYAKSGDVNIAYSVVGDGPFDVVSLSGWVLSNLEHAWQGSSREFFEGNDIFQPSHPLRQAGDGTLRQDHGHPRSVDPYG